MTWFLRLFRRAPASLASRLIAVSIINTSGGSALR
jgi:hypothetical protein